MRMIGHLTNEAQARLLGDYLYASGVDNQVELGSDGRWALWIHSEDDLGRATQVLAEFNANPGEERFRKVGSLARERREEKERKDRQASRRMFDRNRVFPSMSGRPGTLTILLVGLSVLVALLSGLGRNVTPVLGLFISEYDVTGGWWGRLVGGLPEIKQGQVWRLVTPIFVHFGLLHLLFNMMWMLDLGNLIERYRRWTTLLALVLVSAVLSNLGQYLAAGPSFGGMSGVVYCLFGYVWLRARLDPAWGIELNPTTVWMMVIWYLLCLVHFIPHVANTAHTVGFAVGLAWGWASGLHARQRWERARSGGS